MADFWLKNGMDAEHGGIYTCLDRKGRIYSTDKSVWMQGRCGSNEGSFQFGSVPAKVAQLVLMDAVFQEYCRRNREDCEEKIQSIASALSAKHV